MRFFLFFYPLYLFAQPAHQLHQEHSLQAGEHLVSPQGIYEFKVQNDGNMVVYANSEGAQIPIWSSSTTGHDGQNILLVFQHDGNLVLYINEQPVWDVETHVQNGNLTIQDDGNLVIYDRSQHPVWSTQSIYNPGCLPASSNKAQIYLLEAEMYLHNIGMRHQGLRFLSFDGGGEFHLSPGGLNICGVGQYSKKYTAVIHIGEVQKSAKACLEECRHEMIGKNYGVDDVCWTITKRLARKFGVNHPRLDKGRCTEPLFVTQRTIKRISRCLGEKFKIK